MNRWLIRVALLVVAWIVGGATFGMIPLFFPDPSGGAERLSGMETGFSTCDIWVFYRIGAQLPFLRLPKPRGKMLAAIRWGWTIFAYVFTAGVVIAAIGHPSIAAAIVGLPAAIAVYVFLGQLSKSESQTLTR